MTQWSIGVVVLQAILLCGFAYGVYVLATIRRRARSERIPALGLCLFCAVLSAAFVPPTPMGGSSVAASCLSNAKNIALTHLMYASDHDGRFSTANGLEGALGGLARSSPKAFHCPSTATPFGYASNRWVLGRVERTLQYPDRTVLVFESDAPRRIYAAGWESLTDKPRHKGRDTYAFADGHAKLISRDSQEPVLFMARNHRGHRSP